MGTDCMPTMQPRYGRPRGTGLDDSHQLESIAALLAANPGLKPTTAIRSLGVDDPSVIRRLRDKFRMDQARLLANARRSFQSGGHSARALGRHGSQRVIRRHIPAVPCIPSNNIPVEAIAVPDTEIAVETARVATQPLLPAIVCELGLWALTMAIEQHAVLARHWLHHPAVDNAMRAQLAAGAFLVAVASPRKSLMPRSH